MVQKKVAVIGGGLGGLSAAARLAVMGFEVDLFEKNETVGGKANQIE
ncbi:MAG: NAD(P)-binding protein [Melioribacteraceae bacterium]|nr:NAD(P)-binding protein [Melioribacteraceae bacterium]